MSVNSVKSLCIFILMAFALQACGGRAADPVLQYNALDQAFSCEHLKAEFNFNMQKFKALNEEQEQKIRDNAAQLILGSPFLLDFTTTLDKERAAIQTRNEQIKKLAVIKSCAPFGAHKAGNT